MKRAAVLWTGGKDCCLAMYEGQKLGYSIEYLVTLKAVDEKSSWSLHQRQFRAHPAGFREFQAQSLGIPYIYKEVRKPFKQGYREQIKKLVEEYHLDTLISGDIEGVCGNWIQDCVVGLDVEIKKPLWGWDRLELLESLLENGFELILSCVRKPWFTADWLGRKLSYELIRDLKKIDIGKPLDLCGEAGEYHSLVLDGPIFKKRLEIGSFSYNEEEEYIYIDIEKVNCFKKEI